MGAMLAVSSPQSGTNLDPSSPQPRRRKATRAVKPGLAARGRQARSPTRYFFATLVMVSCGKAPVWKNEARVCASAEPPSHE